MTHLRDAISGPLIKEGMDGVPAALQVMQDYYLLREDIDSLMELSLWPDQKDPMSLVEGKVTDLTVKQQLYRYNLSEYQICLHI
jgi:replication factor C subunit 1